MKDLFIKLFGKKSDRKEENIDYDGYCKRGNVKFENQDIQGALKEFTRAIEIDPECTEAYLERGNIKVATDDFNGAIKDFTKIIELDPGNSIAYFSRGMAKSMAGKPGSDEDLHMASKLNPKGMENLLKDFR